jgi:hypothetical protein
MSIVEIVGLFIAVIHLLVALVALLSPPKELKEKYVHTFYIVGMVTLSMIFLYLDIWSPSGACRKPSAD